jgi:hypothetical protein
MANCGSPGVGVIPTLSSSDLESACPVSLLESLMLSGMGLLPSLVLFNAGYLLDP